MPQVLNRPSPEQQAEGLDRVRRFLFGTPPGDPSGGSPHPGLLEFTPLAGIAGGIGKGIRSAAIANLLKQAQGGDQQATSTLMEGLAQKLKGIAGRFQRGTQTGDLINVGNEGILRQIPKTVPETPNTEARFLNRAKMDMRDYLSQDRVANLPKEDKLAYGQIRNFERQWAGRHPDNPVPSDEVVAMRLFAPRKASPSAPDISPQANRDATEMVRRLRSAVPSLKGVSTETIAPSGERVPRVTRGGELSVQPVEPKEASVSKLFDRLNDKERQIVEGFYDEINPKTDADLAKQLGITPQRVGQLRRRAIDKLGEGTSGGAPSPEDEWYKQWRVAHQENTLQKHDIVEARGDPTDIGLYTDPRYEQGFTNLLPRSISAADQQAQADMGFRPLLNQVLREGYGKATRPTPEPDPEIVRQLGAKQSLSQGNPRVTAEALPLVQRDRLSANEVERIMRGAGYRWTTGDTGEEIMGMPMIRSEPPTNENTLSSISSVPRPIFSIKGEQWNPSTPGNESIDIVNPGGPPPSGFSPAHMTPDEAVSWLQQLRRDSQVFRQQRGSAPPDIGGR